MCTTGSRHRGALKATARHATVLRNYYNNQPAKSRHIATSQLLLAWDGGFDNKGGVASSAPRLPRLPRLPRAPRAFCPRSCATCARRADPAAARCCRSRLQQAGAAAWARRARETAGACAWVGLGFGLGLGLELEEGFGFGSGFAVTRVHAPERCDLSRAEDEGLMPPRRARQQGLAAPGVPARGATRPAGRLVARRGTVVAARLVRAAAVSVLVGERSG